MHNLWVYVCRNGTYADQIFYIVGVSILDYFCSCDLDLNPMTFIYELDPYTGCAKMNFLHQLAFRKLSYYSLQI